MTNEQDPLRGASESSRNTSKRVTFRPRHAVILVAVGLVACVTVGTEGVNGLDDTTSANVRPASLSLGPPASSLVDATIDDATIDAGGPVDARVEASDAVDAAACESTLAAEQLLDLQTFALLANTSDAGDTDTPIAFDAAVAIEAAAPLDGGGNDGSAGNPETGPRPHAPYGEGGACVCPTVTIHCVTPADGGFEGMCMNCVLILPPNVCSMHGLHNGSVVDPMPIIGAENWPTPPTAQAIFDYCVADHEARHACDAFQTGRMCLTEINAYATSVKCMDDAYAKFCSGDVKPSFCYQLREDNLQAQGEGSMNQCLCNNPQESCVGCEADCEALAPYNNPFWKMGCTAAARSYCVANRRYF